MRRGPLVPCPGSTKQGRREVVGDDFGNLEEGSGLDLILLNQRQTLSLGLRIPLPILSMKDLDSELTPMSLQPGAVFEYCGFVCRYA